jgi:hypothetical protein
MAVREDLSHEPGPERTTLEATHQIYRGLYPALKSSFAASANAHQEGI